MTAAEFKAVVETNIEGITEPTIGRYFQTLNAQDFHLTAALFAEDGVMYPPFESGIIGPEAIAAYLQLEAQDLKAFPEKGITEVSESGHIQIQVTGKAQSSWCGVNVLWLFILNQQRQILEVRIKLLASPQELLALRRDQNNGIQAPP